jgi:tetratricopeptide (TPR) repeat protein
MKYAIQLFLCFLIIGVNFTEGNAQNAKLADQYYLDGEYEKAADIFQALYKKSNRSDYYFNRYIECLMALEDFSESEKIIKNQIKSNPKMVNLHVSLGNVLERQNKFEEADAEYQIGIENLTPNVQQITKLGNSFVMLAKYDLAIQTYEQGGKVMKNPGLFSYNLADLYRRKGDKEKMIEQYLISLHTNPKRLNAVQSVLQRNLRNEEFELLQEKLYESIQDYPETDHFPEMLAWVFIQQKDYKSAFRQVRALDKRLNENGSRVYSLAQVAANAKDFDTAIQAFDYIVSSKGANNTYYLEAKRASLANKRKRLVSAYEYSQEDLKVLEGEYETFLNEFGWNKSTAQIVSELARLEAFYLNDLNRAIELLNQVIQYPGVQKHVQANAKISLADYYLMQGEIWESTLLYSQVDKAFQEETLGEKARFKNAKLSYYNGDFEWAQTQFDVLKASTSKLISNDALDLSIFIMDNLGLDTTDHPMTVYAEADLLIFQNRFDEAIEKLTILSNLYPEHGLLDDIKYAKAQIAVKRRAYEEAESIFMDIIENHKEEIRADNSMFELATLYENQLKQVEKAKMLYERLFIEFSGSTFSIEARKRYRILRGDFSEEPLN